MNVRQKHGFTLVEVLIVVVIMAVLAATIIPQFSNSAEDAKANTALFNLHTLRSQVELFKSQHDGNAPATLDLLAAKTNRSGAIDSSGPYGPYIHEIPANPLVNADSAQVVAAATSNPPAAVADDAGWLYHAASGGVWINHADYLTE